jgi:hypothetical protein
MSLTVLPLFSSVPLRFGSFQLRSSDSSSSSSRSCQCGGRCSSSQHILREKSERISSEDDNAEVGILQISPISHSVEQRRNEAVRQPEERKNSECPRRWMNIRSVEQTGVFKSASREAEDGVNQRERCVDVWEYHRRESRYVCCCCFLSRHNIIYNCRGENCSLEKKQ